MISVGEFYVGDKVFCKGWPQVMMEFVDLDFTSVVCQWWVNGEVQVVKFLPEMLMHYAYAGLVVMGGHKLCLN